MLTNTALPVTVPVKELGAFTVGVPATSDPATAALGYTARAVAPPAVRLWPICPRAAANITHDIGDSTGPSGPVPPSSGANTERIPVA